MKLYSFTCGRLRLSLHAGVATKAHERDKLEKICRYIARPAVAQERLSSNEQGEVIYKFKKPWDDGTTAIKLTPMELMERLAAFQDRELLKRVFDIDISISICSKCSGKIKIIAVIEDPTVIKKILEHLGLASSAPRLMQARGPPLADQSDFFAQEFYED